MLPYFLVLILSLALMYAYESNRNNKIYLFFVGIVLATLVGFRSELVGTDTMGYCRTFFNMQDYHSLPSVFSSFTTEKGWLTLNYLLSRLGDHYYILLLAVGIICNTLALYIINKQSTALVLSLFVYITLAFYLFAFAAVRQSVAMSIYMLALPYLLNKDFKRYVVVVIIAALFHQTVLIALPLYFFFRMPYSKKTLALVTVGGLVMGALVSSIMVFASTVEDRYSVYTEFEGGGELFTVFYVILAIFFVVQRSKIKKESRAHYDIMLNMLIFGGLVYLMVTLSGLYGEVTRFAAYFQFSVMFLWAELYTHRKKKLSVIFWVAVAIGHLGYFYIYLSKIGHITPYLFNAALN